MVEAVHCEKPNERAYLHAESLADMMGAMLEAYIDEELKIQGPAAKSKKKPDDAQTGHPDQIQRILFSQTP